MALTDTKSSIKRICLAGVFMALNIAVSSFGVPVPGGHFYLNDIVICTASILLDPFSALCVGGIGAFLGDLFFYPTPMFVSLVVRSVQAVIISVFANRILKSKPVLSAIIGVSIGALIMIAGYSFGRAFIYGTVEYAVLKLPYQIIQAVIGAVVSIILCYNLKFIKIVRKYGF